MSKVLPNCPSCNKTFQFASRLKIHLENTIHCKKTPEEITAIIDIANSVRTTHNTVTNEVSSRSHAICNVNFYFKI